MLLGALGAPGAETALVQLALAPLDAGVNMHIEALVARVAEAIRRKEAALGHAPQVVLVQVVARIAFFAQSTQPVLAHRPPHRIAPERRHCG